MSAIRLPKILVLTVDQSHVGRVWGIRNAAKQKGRRTPTQDPGTNRRCLCVGAGAVCLTPFSGVRSTPSAAAAVLAFGVENRSLAWSFFIFGNAQSSFPFECFACCHCRHA